MLAFWLTLCLATPLQDALTEVSSVRSLRLAKNAPQISTDTYNRLEAGEVVTGMVVVPNQKAKRVWSAAIVDVNISRFWAAINDDKNKVKNSKLTHSVVLNGEYCAPSRTVFQYLPIAFLTDRWWVIEINDNAALKGQTGGKVREMVWNSVSDMPSKLTEGTKPIAAQGMPVAFTEGAWFLVDLGNDSTLVEYFTFSDPGGSVPASLASSLSARTLDKTMQTMTLAAKGSPACPF